MANLLVRSPLVLRRGPLALGLSRRASIRWALTGSGLFISISIFISINIHTQGGRDRAASRSRSSGRQPAKKLSAGERAAPRQPGMGDPGP